MASSVALIVVVSVAWATLHSLLASRPVKARVRERFGQQTDRWYRAAFVAVTGLTLWPVVYLLLRLPSRLVYTVPGPWSWLMHAGQLLAVAAIVGSVRQVGGFRRFVGIEQWQGKITQPDTLQIGRFYGCVRHPMFLSAMTLIWLTPTITVTLLTGYVVATLYFVAATFLEENKLVATFGDTYRAYQQRVPRLIPRPGQCMCAWRGELAADSSRASKRFN